MHFCTLKMTLMCIVRILLFHLNLTSPIRTSIILRVLRDVVWMTTSRRRSVSKREKSKKKYVKLSSKKWKRKYDLTRKYQMEWAAKAPWNKAVLRDNGILHVVKCIICTGIGRKPSMMALNWDTMNHHNNHKCHKKNQLLYASQRPTSMLDQIQGCTFVESRCKRIQFASVFHILFVVYPM